ncbi:winged helix-turn-helix domain-containing protein [Arthrobacter sp. NPDC058130]|uniref:winged helix-turn-helix domain-containing protein n=1 Tax=Arthrobacter sp. NPDC058130 TaxID=3346353 RepID=UPI0036E6B421
MAGTAPAGHGRAQPNGQARQGQARANGQARPTGQARQAGLTARGLAVWVTVPDGADLDPACLARAAELVLGRALRCAPEAEVHFRPAAGAATSAVVRSPEDDGGAGAGACPAPGPPRHPIPGSISRLAVDLAAGDARLDGERVPLTELEFTLLRCLVQNCSRTVSRQELQQCLDAFDTPGAATRSIDVYVGRLRRKLKGCRHAVVTVRSGGYRFIPGPMATVRGPAEYSI